MIWFHLNCRMYQCCNILVGLVGCLAVQDASVERKGASEAATAVCVTVTSHARHSTISSYLLGNSENAATRTVSRVFCENDIAFNAARFPGYLERMCT